MAGFFIPGIGQGGGANPNPNPDSFTQVRFDPQTNELVLTTAGGVAIPVDLSAIKPTITQGVIKSVNIVNKELVIEDVDGQIVQIPLSRVLGGVDITLTPIQGIQSDNVQGAIEELKRDMALLDNSDIFIVPDEAELEKLLQTPNALKKGDIVYIIDSTNVVDFNNQDVSNNGKPVAMIYDSDLTTGNKLRVFSKIDSPINITASNVAFAPTQHVTSTNVQEAIEEVSGKTITTGAINGNNIVLTQENGSQINVDVTRLIGINTINTESPDAQGNIDLALEMVADELQFKVNNDAKNRLELYTDADANTLIQYFV